MTRHFTYTKVIKAHCDLYFMGQWFVLYPQNQGIYDLPDGYFWIMSQCKNKWAASWENQHFAYAKTKTQISFALAFVFAT